MGCDNCKSPKTNKGKGNMNNEWDIYFISEQSVKSSEIFAKLKERENYSFQGISAIYSNELTGTKFCIQGVNSHENEGMLPITLLMIIDHTNSGHARETAQEVHAIIDMFNARIFYPLSRSTSGEIFSKRRFLEQWQKQRQRELEKTTDEQFYFTCSMTIETVWNWNYSQQWTQKFLQEEQRVPLIQFGCFENGEINSYVEFNSSESVALPKVDYYILTHEETTGLFKQKKNTRLCIVPFLAIRHILDRMRYMPFDRAPFYKYTPERAADTLPSALENLSIRPYMKIAYDKILDEELASPLKVINFEDSSC
jgi:hypothetical protein